VNWQGALTQRLLDDAAVAAIVEDRVRWDEAEQDDAVPFIILTVIEDSRPRHMEGGQGFRPSFVQIDCYHGGSKLAALTLREAAIDALAAGGVFDGVRFDPLRIEAVRSEKERISGTEVRWRESVDIILFHD